MDATKPITTRRVIKPGGGDIRVAEPAPAAPQARPAASPALNPMWRAWLTRFNEVDAALIAADARERNGWINAPRQSNPAEMQRIQDRFLAPWSGVVETFAVAAIASPLSDAQRRDLQTYLDLRAAFYRCLMKRFLVPSDLTLRQLAETQARLDAALAARTR